MKILIINASPRKNGTVSQLLNEITKHLPATAEVELQNIYNLHFKPCVGCMKCRTTNVCCLQQDDAHLFAEKINACDALIVGTPTYWGNMNGLLKMLFDRTVPAFMGESLKGLPQARQKGKCAAIVTACTTPFPFNVLARQSSGTVRAVKEILHYGGFKIVGTLAQAGTRNKKEISKRTMRKAEQIAERIIK